ncbi:MAG: 50S ribosomal protein L15 [Thermodesulfovibrionales bacterium]|nr:50S ribosomal protein L15 [Thermodesulfovibrionales bacterium]
MKIEELKPAPGSKKRKKRVGRGIGSGHGKTSTRGHKGQKARSGGTKGAGFEGGQMPLQRRLPKRGFTNAPFKKEYAIINLKDIEKYGLSEVSPEVLLEKGIIKDLKSGLKVLGEGEIKRPLKVRAHAFSESALEKLKAVGSTVEVISS